nr:MAG TPA: hypothetical protein [Caudoviricetes sp.]
MRVINCSIHLCRERRQRLVSCSYKRIKQS